MGLETGLTSDDRYVDKEKLYIIVREMVWMNFRKTFSIIISYYKFVLRLGIRKINDEVAFVES